MDSSADQDYEWLKLNVFSRWDPSARQNMMAVFDAKPEIKRQIRDLLSSSSDAMTYAEPQTVHMLAATIIFTLQEEAVWKIRDSVRNIELTRTLAAPNYSHLHDLARHAIHVLETLELASLTLERMIKHCNTFTTKIPATDEVTATARCHVNDRLQFYHDSIQSLRLRATANRDRLLNEIQYSFNIVAQNIANASNIISHAVQTDSSAVKTIVLVTAGFPNAAASSHGMPIILSSETPVT
ncbi:uncharacterized protein KY384_002394 [Bacidia gigantensis]|uniref:uncharacterized protein n=1 Tax=Bacidia gigantensis TaxID=2732470 RepID=UPI001D0381F8|nr:uncharacterized protein KY384_002394 [Bacidia gigantensis]KAG8532517.1 hypothetical protein KY384_002394 [Bacidia gigantensis]